MSENPEMRVVIDGSTHPIHDNVSSLRAFLEDGDYNAEVQVGRLGDRIVVVAAGDIEHRVDERGFHYLSVFPTPAKVTATT